MANFSASKSDWSGEKLSPDEVLYYLDGPAIFLKRVGPFNLLFVKADEKEDADLYIAAQVGRKQVDFLKSGKLSVRGALLSGALWAFELDLDLTVVRYQEVSERQIEAFLPRNGVGLRFDFGLVPDSIHQSEASYAFKFFGDGMSEEGMPFSTFRSLVDHVYSTLRKALTPTSLGQGKSASILDFPMRPVEFASLVIAIDEPKIDDARLKRGKNTKDLDAATVLAESEELGSSFARDLKRTVEAASKGDSLPERYAADNLDFLLTLVEILPSQRSDVKRLQFSANRTDGQDIFVDVDLLTAEKIRASVREVEDTKIDLHGFISGVLAKSNTIHLQTRYKREVTCKISAEVFEDLLTEEKLIIGKPIVVSGSYTKRALRDYMKVEGFPTFP